MIESRVLRLEETLTEPDSSAKVRGRRLEQVRDALAVPLAVFVITRVLLAVLAASASRLLSGPAIRANASVLPPSDVLSNIRSWAAPWFRFDAYWYVNVAQRGYHWLPGGKANTNFPPLYPILIRLVQPLALGSSWLAAWVISNAFFLVALILLWHWARQRWSREIALRVLLLVSLFPFAFFFSAPYTESLFLALAIAAFLLAERNHWYAASGVAALALLARPAGPAVVAGLIVLAWRRGDRKALAVSLCALLPFAAFALYVGMLTGHPLAIAAPHSDGWVAPHGGLLMTLGAQFHTKLSPFDRVDAAVALLFLGSAFLVWKRLGPAYAAYVAVGVLLPLIRVGLSGMERYAIVLFPVMAAWALIENKWLQFALFAGSLSALMLFTTMFAAGYTLT